MFYPAVMLAALYGGLRAGLLATVLSGALASYFWMEPRGSLGISDPGDWLSMVISGVRRDDCLDQRCNASGPCPCRGRRDPGPARCRTRGGGGEVLQKIEERARWLKPCEPSGSGSVTF